MTFHSSPTVSAKEIVLNPEQQEASHEFFNFLMGNQKEFRVSGPAGTGKTTLMGYMVGDMLQQYHAACALLGIPSVNFEVHLTATTNKAAEVLANATRQRTNTIHSHLCLRVKDDYKTGKQTLIRRPDWAVKSRQIIVIDEASMVDHNLYREIHKGTDDTCKILYLGDHCQLAPVNEKLSRVYQTKDNSAFLTQPMRNAGQPLLVELSDALRSTVETLQFFDIPAHPGVIDVFTDPQDAFQFIADHFSQETETSRILGYTNNVVQQYNTHIRALRNYPNHFVAGETVLVNSAFEMARGLLLSAQEEVFVIDSDESDQRHRVAMGIDIHSYWIKIKSRNTIDPITFYVPFSFSKVQEALRAAYRAKDFDTYFSLKNTYPDFRQKDAITVYKAQGSTYETVFMDLDDIGTCTHSDQLARMLYVAATRARSRVVIWGALPNRLF